MKIDLTMVMQIVSYMMIAVGVMAFMVSFITQVIKELPWLKELPTQAVVIALALLLCPLTMAAVFAWQKIKIEWYMVFACMLLSMMVAFVAMYGWDTLVKLWERSHYPQKGKGI